MEKQSNSIRLNRYLSRCGRGSRRECDRLIESGAVSVNGGKVVKLGTKVNPHTDTISVRGRKLGKVLPLQYFAYHKSKGSITTLKDEQGRETIYDALAKNGFNASHLKYVGRLDRNSEGLLLLTNDGDLVHALTHPRFEIKKVYIVRTDRPLTEEHAMMMTSDGIRSEGQVLRAAKIRAHCVEHAPGQPWYEIVLFEGKNRQIRRMFEALGYEIIRLKRIQFAVIKLGNLRRGAYRQLAEREVIGLKKMGYRRKG